MKSETIIIMLLVIACIALGGLLIYYNFMESDEIVTVEEQEEQNKAMVRRLHEELAANNYDFIDDSLAPGWIRHCQAMPPELQEISDVEVFKSFLREFKAGCPDNADTIDLMVAEGDMVSYIVTMRGTQTGEMEGLPPLGNSYELVNFVIHRFKDGKVAETWVVWDNMAMLRQLGHLPPAGAEATATE
jgi:predicted ester cyclase